MSLAHAMEQSPKPEQSRLAQMASKSGEAYNKIRKSTLNQLEIARASLHAAIKTNPYLNGIKIINISKLYSLKITGGTLNETIELNPVMPTRNGNVYDVKYLLMEPLDIITIQTFRPGSAIANETKFRRLRGKDVLVINVDRITHSTVYPWTETKPNEPLKEPLPKSDQPTMFYPPVIMIDAYSHKKAKELYPDLDL